MSIDKDINQLVERATQGDQYALERIIFETQDYIYGLALRMLGLPQDAQDATQEILIRLITNLGSFRNDSAFSTWVYRIAANHLLTTRQRKMERREYSFEVLINGIESGLANPQTYEMPAAELKILSKEIEITCTQMMLMCLDREHRLTFILAEIFELDSNEGAAILEITAPAFRQRLARARKEMMQFLSKNCGLAKEANPCRCEKHIAPSLQSGLIKRHRLQFTNHPVRSESSDAQTKDRAIRIVNELKAVNRVLSIFRHQPQFVLPESFTETTKRLINSGNFEVFSD